MGYSGYLDKDSENILSNYRLLIEQQPVVGMAGAGMAQPGDASVPADPASNPGVLDALFQSPFWLAVKILDPTGFSNWPDLYNQAIRTWEVSTNKNNSWPEKAWQWIMLSLAAVCIVPAPMVFSAIKGVALKAMRAALHNPKAALTGFEEVVNKILQSKDARNTMLDWVNNSLTTVKDYPAINQILMKFKNVLQTGKFNMSEFLGIPAGQIPAAERFLESSRLVLRGDKAVIIPAAGTQASKEFWQNIAQKAAAGELPNSPMWKKVLGRFGKELFVKRTAGGVLPGNAVLGGRLAKTAGTEAFGQQQTRLGVGPGSYVPMTKNRTMLDILNTESLKESTTPLTPEKYKESVTRLSEITNILRGTINNQKQINNSSSNTERWTKTINVPLDEFNIFLQAFTKITNNLVSDPKLFQFYSSYINNYLDNLENALTNVNFSQSQNIKNQLMANFKKLNY